MSEKMSEKKQLDGYKLEMKIKKLKTAKTSLCSERWKQAACKVVLQIHVKHFSKSLNIPQRYHNDGKKSNNYFFTEI